MKIGILTFHCAHNYGAVLQAYATQTFLQSQGFEVVMVDYRPEYLVSPYRVFDWKSYWTGSLVSFLRTAFSKLCLLPANKKRSKAFESFITQRLRLQGIDFTRKGDIDAFVFGSDQIWNPILCKGFDPVYFGQFEAAAGKKKIAYAASMGSLVLQDEQERFYREVLPSLDAISVREESLQSLLSPLSPRPIQQVLDPTFLLAASAWRSIARNPQVDSPYVLVYQVVAHPETMRIAQTLAKQLHGKVIELKATLKLFQQSPYQCASPEEFLGYFNRAACVVTTSFHGTAFSLLFNRPFYTIQHGNRHDARSQSLLDRLSLLDRFIPGDSQLQFTPIDYQGVNAQLQQEIARSQHYLLSALEQ